jgi:hypothetical protein
LIFLWILIIFFFTVTLIITFLCTDIKYVFTGFKKGIGFTAITIDKLIAEGKRSRVGRLIKFTDEMILNSNINLFIPYNALIHFLICIVGGTITFVWVSSSLNFVISFLFSMIGFILPYSILQLVSEFMTYKIKKYSVDLLIILKNFFASTGDIFIAFEKTQDFCIEPIKTYIEIMVFEFKYKIDPERCMDNFIKKIGYKELKLFMENLKIAYIHGSDINLLIDEFINEIGNLNDDSDKEDAEDKILNIGLYALLFLNFTIVKIVLNSSYRLEITNTISGQVVFIADIFISFYILYLTLQRVD